MKRYDLSKPRGDRVPSPGICIYCREPFPSEQLTDEHVVPFALAHNTLIYEKSSCSTCQKVIHKYESDLLERQWGNFRKQVGAPSRTKKKYRKTHQRTSFIEFDDSGTMMRELGSVNIPIDDLPLAIPMWKLGEPKIFWPSEQTEHPFDHAITLCDQHAADEWNRRVAEKFGCTNVGMKVAECNRDHFLRFLAKTAHAYATAMLGVDGFDPLLCDVIRNQRADVDYFVGGTGLEKRHDTQPEDTMVITLGKVDGEEDDLLVARLHFYPELGTLPYMVVVGQWTEMTGSRMAQVYADQEPSPR